MIFACCDENRRAAVLNNPSLNAIDFLELLDVGSIVDLPVQQILLIYCLKPVPSDITPDNVLIRGGESITGITALWTAPASTPPGPPQCPADVASYVSSLANAANILVVRTSQAGDFSPYTLSLVQTGSQTTGAFAVTNVLSGFDPQLSSVTFSFKIDCGPYFDCQSTAPDCSPALPTPPPINYLAKDYGSFRGILLDRMNQLLPAWGASSEADLGVVLAELVAYAGDQLSYHQDAVATEAYLLTARRRVSLRRHARLVDYVVHDGCNSRAWVCVNVSVPVFLDQAATRFYTDAPGMPATLAGNEQAALAAGVVAFESMQDANLFPEHNTLQFYTWGDTNCCLAQGATEATLAGSFPNLQPGDVLIFSEVVGPQTGVAADADIRHRYAVRLTAVATVDSQGRPLVDPLFEITSGVPIVSASQQPQPVTEIAWSSDDALPAPLCVSSTFKSGSGNTQTIYNVSVAYGNVVLADQGLSMPAWQLPVVPEASLYVPPATNAGQCSPSAPAPLPVRYRPQLADSPVTQAVPLPTSGAPVTATAVPLVANGLISLLDSSGYTSLMIGAHDIATWPQYVGVLATAGTLPGTFTLNVVSLAAGTTPIALESYANLATPAQAVLQISQLSRLIAASTPAGAITPSSFPTAPTMLSLTSAVPLNDTSNLTYLNIQPTAPQSWPPLFAVLAQGNLQVPGQFNLLLLYDSPFGSVGDVILPAVVEQFNNVSLASAGTTFGAGSSLLDVLTFEQQPNPALSAYDLMNYDAANAVPSISLSDENDTSWTAAIDLLADGPANTNFVVEVETDGTATLRFGDGTNGMSPAANTLFTATYRIGNGSAGNIGAQSLTHFAGDPRIISCTNPLPASGGVDPETPAQIQRRAPVAFLTQERAITLADYASAAEQNTQVESAAASLRWTGSWYTVFVTAETQSGSSLAGALRKSLKQTLNGYRLAGQDLELFSPDYVSLQVVLTVCVDPAYFQTDVQQALQKVLGSGTQPNGQPGVFAPSNFQLGQTVYLSPIYAAARSVPGVTSVVATQFQPLGAPLTQTYIDTGEIEIGPSQVARLTNDRSLPANGQLTLNMQGGR